jgi:hypothetical protein
MKEYTIEELYAELLELELFTEEELQLITDLNGYNIETLNNALFCRYGYRNLSQMLEEQK